MRSTPIHFSTHAEERAAERNLSREAIEAIVRRPWKVTLCDPETGTGERVEHVDPVVMGRKIRWLGAVVASTPLRITIVTVYEWVAFGDGHKPVHRRMARKCVEGRPERSRSDRRRVFHGEQE